MNTFLLIISLLLNNTSEFKLQTGDLIFQEACDSKTGNVIKEVTSSIDNYQFTHVGIVYIDENDSIFVIEATRPKVCVTPLSKYLYPDDGKCYPKSVVGRLKDEYQHCIPQAIKEGLKLVGKDYDDGFILNNDKYTSDGWVEYFKKYDLPIPEGELGINPGAMSRSGVVDIVSGVKFYAPTKNK